MKGRGSHATRLKERVVDAPMTLVLPYNESSLFVPCRRPRSRPPRRPPAIYNTHSKEGANEDWFYCRIIACFTLSHPNPFQIVSPRPLEWVPCFCTGLPLPIRNGIEEGSVGCDCRVKSSRRRRRNFRYRKLLPRQIDYRQLFNGESQRKMKNNCWPADDDDGRVLC